MPTLAFALVFHYFVRNCLKLSSLKQHTVIVSQVLWVRSPGTASLGARLAGSPDCNQRVHWGFCHVELGVLFLTVKVIGRVQSLVAVVLKVAFSFSASGRISLTSGWVPVPPLKASPD